ncbi:MAG: hypothetical protein WD055_00260 [Candidatus Dependentiae bacterium]
MNTYKMMMLPLAFISLTGLEARERDPEAKNVYTLKRNRAIRPETPLLVQAQSFAQLCCACAQLTVPDDCKGKIVVGSIQMPGMGSIPGSGPGFTYVADATTGTVVITFDTLVLPVVTATAQDTNAPRTVQIIDRTNNTVTLSINGFVAGEPTIVDFHAIQFACP